MATSNPIMLRSRLILSLIATILLVSCSIATADDIDPSKLSYKLSFQWPKGYCKTKSSGCEKATGLPEAFTIHGLWPIYKGKCTDSTQEFKDDLVSSIRTQLESHWPDLKNFNNKAKYSQFWKHEWDDHGKKCAIFDVPRYFSRSLELLSQSNVQTIVSGKPKKAEDVRKLFPNKEPYVRCKKGNDDILYFFQIEFCLDGKQQYVKCAASKDKSLCPDGEEFSYGELNEMIFFSKFLGEGVDSM